MKTMSAILIAVCLILTANLHSFYLGCRSGLNPNNDAWNMADSIFTRIKQANYNNTMTNITSDNINTIRAKLNTHGLKSVLLDYRTGDNDNPTHWKSASALGLSNYMQFEAEYFNSMQITQIDYNNDAYWYCSNGDDNNRVGSVTYNDSKSNSYTWKVEPDLETPKDGYVFSNLKWRWRPDKRIGDQFQFTGRNFMMVPEEQLETKLKDFYADNYLYVTFAIEFDAGSLVGIGDTENLLSIEFVAYPDELPGSTPIAHENMANGTSGDVTYLTKGQYQALYCDPANRDDKYNLLLKIRVSLLDLYEDGYLLHKDDNYWKTIMGFLAPKLYWYGQGSLQLDYVLMHDSVYDALQTITAETNNHSNYITAASDILGGYNQTFTNTDAFNEPKHPQFKSFSKIENELESEISNFPGLFTSLHDSYKDYEKPNGKGFDNPMLFLKQTKPRLFMPNPYHLEAEYDFNSDDETSVQTVFNSLCTKYRDYKFELLSSTEYAQTKYYICVQTMGYWWGFRYDPAQDNDTGWSWLRPPKETQKAMQFLPLCYGVDGIHDFMFQSFNSVDEVGYWHAININNGVIEPSDAYYGLKEANEKIAVYGPLLSSPVTHDPDHSPQLTWRDAVTIPVSETPVSIFPPNHPSPGILDLGLDGLAVVPASNGYYQGHVQAGLYKDMVSGLPSFMLVNRRGNYFDTSQQYTSPKFAPPSLLDNYFYSAEPQTVRFYINQDAHTMVGDYVGLYDPASNVLFSSENDTINVSIDPGDGVLLQMAGTLPEVVTAAATLKERVFLQGEIQISDGVEVEVLPNTIVSIMDNTHFILGNGALLNLSGTISFGDSVRFSIADQATVNISDAKCEFQGALFIDGNGYFNVADSTSCTYNQSSQTHISNNAKVTLSGVQTYNHLAQVIVTDLSELSYENAVLNLNVGVRIKADNSFLNFSHSSISHSLVLGDSIIVNNLSSINIQNTSIRNTPIFVRGSDLLMENSYIEVKNQRPGISISNPYTDRSVRIIGDLGRNVFTGVSQNGTRGIEVLISHSPIIIRNADFNSLLYGIQKTSTTTVPDSVFDCSFENCLTGIYETSSGACGKIENCSFTNRGIAPNIGIYLIGSIPTISQCSFNACSIGVFFDGSYYAPRESGIYNSSFQMCDVAIETRSANPRVQDCDFYMNDVGLKCHNDSNANLSQNAGNSFRNTGKNIQFLGDDEYHSYIQLIEGHNDFWHFGTPDQSIAAYDFHFDDFYSSSTSTAIDASKNWFEADSVLINVGDNPHYESYIYVEAMDEGPNTPATDPDGSNRYLVALHQEATGQFDQAAALYQTILNEGLENEEGYFGGCVDGLYRVSCLQEIQAAILAEYLEQKITQFTPIDSSFCKLLSDYQIKAYVVSGDFQSAIDIIQARIEFPVNVIDSLRAVLDLEIVLQLESLKEAKKPLSLKYTQYRYPNAQIFYQKHEEHLQELYKLMDKSNEENGIPIPPTPQISSNYPNPFNPSTTIAFSIPEPGVVKLTIYNLKGQKVKEILSSNLPKGHHKAIWDGRDSKDNNVSSGIYFVKLDSGGRTSLRKVMLMK